jgi:hypothetical protein
VTAGFQLSPDSCKVVTEGDSYETEAFEGGRSGSKDVRRCSRDVRRGLAAAVSAA